MSDEQNAAAAALPADDATQARITQLEREISEKEEMLAAMDAVLRELHAAAESHFTADDAAKLAELEAEMATV